MNGNNRRKPRSRKSHPRLPRILTASVPFSVGKNKQLLSIPSHTDGLTTQRAVRFNLGHAAAGDFIISYANLFTRFSGEMNISVNTNGRISFTPEWVNFYSIGGPNFSSVAVRIFDEPRVGPTTGSYVNTPYYETVDSSSTLGFCSVKARIPKAATYSIGTDDPPNLQALPFIGYGLQVGGQAFVDVGGTWTIKSISGSTFLNLQD